MWWHSANSDKLVWTQAVSLLLGALCEKSWDTEKGGDTSNSCGPKFDLNLYGGNATT
ncbi:hypothetical protein T11_11319 [Trichinella zimbabwensis]|uniref:Uncharacterized protein n=1 Tax=Trichinella zimbabwensis TaxID=268475 RepID=A0A0V1G7Q7_9BILA|nr:hypothetical protein T11_11319 [Trichinella zimbabwensis]